MYEDVPSMKMPTNGWIWYVPTRFANTQEKNMIYITFVENLDDAMRV